LDRLLSDTQGRGLLVFLHTLMVEGDSIIPILYLPFNNKCLDRL